MIARPAGSLLAATAQTLRLALPSARVGDVVRVERAGGAAVCDVVSVRGSVALAVLRSTAAGLAAGARVERWRAPAPRPFAALGRAFAPDLTPLDGGPALQCRLGGAPVATPPTATRTPVTLPLRTGVRAIDTLLTVGRGARIGIFGGPGTGKSTLLETILRDAKADAVVVALVGERGREAERWIARRSARTAIVCATGDAATAERIDAAERAMMLGEALRAAGAHVLLIVDSVARYVAALRERAIALGETSGRGGYPPSVWATLARYLERAGTAETGSITAVVTVLSDGPDEREPLSDNARSMLDGHVVLSGELAREGRFPAIDVLASASRTMNAVVSPDHAVAAGRVREALARLARTRDARELGLADVADPALVRALEIEPRLLSFLGYAELPGDAVDELRALAAALGA